MTANRLTLTDLLSPATMIAWLNDQEHPPTVQVTTSASYHRWSSSRYGGSKTETKSVSDAETLEVCWKNYRQMLATDWSKSALNPLKPKTHKQEVAEWLSSMGIKGGSVAERIKRAKALRPDLYSDNPNPEPAFRNVAEWFAWKKRQDQAAQATSAA